MQIALTMPPIFRGIVMQQTPSPRVVDVDISFRGAVTIQIRPRQITKLLALLRPLSFHGEWHQRAMLMDESKCTELTDDEKAEYMALYKEQWHHDNELGFVSRQLNEYKLKEQLQARRKRLGELESKVLASRLLLLRSTALNWDIPAGGTPLPHLSDVMVQQKHLQAFLNRSLDTYCPPAPYEPTFHMLNVSISLENTTLQLLENTNRKLLSIFARDMRIDIAMSMEAVQADDKSMSIHLKIPRFGIVDDRNVPSNLFPRLLDRNPDADVMLDLEYAQLGSGHMDVRVALKQFSVLVIFDPLMELMKVFLPALEEDEAVQMRYLAYSSVNSPQTPEQRELSAIAFVEDVPHEYSPLMLYGMSLWCQIQLQGVEICLLGDSASLKSHILAFTSDTKIKVISSSRHEAIEIELVDVALQPCAIVIVEDAIDLEIPGLRTILELEGEGVDLQLGYKLTVGDATPSSQVSSTSSSQSNAKSAKNLWNVARAAVAKRQLQEVEQMDTSKRDHQSSRMNRVKAGARRKLVLNVSDFAINLSPNDLGVFYGILSSLSESMTEDGAVVSERSEREQRLLAASKTLTEQRHMERLKTEFKIRDVDGGGSLDSKEVEDLISSVVDRTHLTKDEFDATVSDFISIVDRDGSGDVSFEEFECVLNRKKTIYHRLHHDVVSLTGQEYVDPSRKRNAVPHLPSDGLIMDIANATALADFWSRYETQVGATKTSLCGVDPFIVQKKMVRTFNNYEYAQEAWLRIVKPSLLKLSEQSPWLLSKEMDMGGRGDVIDQLLSSFDEGASLHEPHVAQAPDLHMFIHTVIATSFGGFYIRLIDEALPLGASSLEFCLEDPAFYANFGLWEGTLSMFSGDSRVHRRSKNNYGVSKLSFSLHGKYYNRSKGQAEPFLEFFSGSLDIRKDPDSELDITFASDRYFQLNLTYALMRSINSTMTTFYKVEKLSEKQRPHIQEEGGLFWLLNETGTNMKYFVVAKSKSKGKNGAHRVETVSAISSVPWNEAHPCVLLSVDDELKDYEQQNLKEKQLRQAFRKADADRSGELDAEEVRTVLREVYEEENKSRKRTPSRDSTYRRTESSFSSETELDHLVEEFIALADTDRSGLVSWEEFKTAISMTRKTVDRFISLEIDGFNTLHDIPIAYYGQTQVFELTPYFEDVEREKSVGGLYQQVVKLLNQSDTPSRDELHRAFACLQRVRFLEPQLDWLDSYERECRRQYTPVLVAVTIAVDGIFGLQVKVTGAECIRNDTSKATECLLIDEHGQVAAQNPAQSGTKERFFVIPQRGSISIPLCLVDKGSFAIRQQGEAEWSNTLPLSVREHRLFKSLTRFEQREAKRIIRENSQASLSSTRMVTEKMGKATDIPDPMEHHEPGKEITFPSSSVIDNQPTTVVEKKSANDSRLSEWYLVIQPQLALHNLLPCGIEFAIVQTQDCPPETLDTSGNFRVVGAKNDDARTGRVMRMLGEIDYFKFVSEVNCRKMFVESGKSVQVFGLDLDQPALFKMRLCANASNRAGQWSPVYEVRLNCDRDTFSSKMFRLDVQ
ncbi:hypothetical protein PINS_up007457 [Pythium insidiosum]|nr:hypothetical protein PINS_up007457 [Pythium insidiosum]